MKVFCLECKRETNHTSLHEVKKTFEDDDAQIWAEGTWQIVQCNGCETISFRESWVSSEDIDPEDGYIENTKIYPIRGKEIYPIKPFYNAPLKIRSIYREMIDAFNNGLLILCAGGLRATIEGICNHENITDGPIDKEINGVTRTQRKKNLQGKISGLFEKGLLTRNHAETLNEHRFLGNEALHSLDQPTKDELKIAIDIVEHTLENLYELTGKASDLRYQKQRRKSKK